MREICGRHLGIDGLNADLPALDAIVGVRHHQGNLQPGRDARQQAIGGRAKELAQTVF
ncbi:hypothetical protein [Leptothrix cholodnii]|uniref:hypothetical protein n=1 Tax=Leptothrix cholodnii TaxID=34029 RepID=UPI00167FAADF|nr:hypothetical protein [Leptothrix cholodnii]